ncbi:MAG: nitroreductase [Proteobacteria bacterium]|nr:nitroreductase [Pseudomonadota bacterium]
MKLDEAINNRYSVRAYLDKPVEKSLIEDILSLAVRAPSWGNTQPWEIAVAAGPPRQALSEEFVSLVSGGAQTQSDFEMPEKFPGVYMDRYRAVGKQLFSIVGIGREDQEARMNHALSMFRGFGAPVLVYILVDTSLTTVYSVFDAGAVANNICLAAASRGLGTCLLAALAWFPDSVRKHLNLAPEKRVVVGIALGYPDPTAKYNEMRTPRVPLSESVTWAGF